MSTTPNPLPQPDPILWKPLDPQSAAEYLRVHSSEEAPEPSLPVVLAMLCYAGPADGIPSRPDTVYRESLTAWCKRFFTTRRMQRILRAVINGDAGDKVVEILGDHLTRKGFYTAGTIGFWLAHRGWMKQCILNCFDPEAWQSFKQAHDLPASAEIDAGFDLAQLLQLPFRNLDSDSSAERAESTTFAPTTHPVGP